MSKSEKRGAALFQSREFKAGRKHRRDIMRVGMFLRSMREQQRLTQDQVAAHSGLYQPEISRLESGTAENGPELGTILRYVRACGAHLTLTFPSSHGGEILCVGLQAESGAGDDAPTARSTRRSAKLHSVA